MYKPYMRKAGPANEVSALGLRVRRQRCYRREKRTFRGALYKVAKAELPINPVPGPSVIGYYEDQFVRSGDQWKFAERKMVAEFAQPGLF